MIICTNKSDTLVKRAFPEKGKCTAISIDKMIAQFALDPTITTPVRECYVIDVRDISGTRVKQRFEQACADKHPNTKIILVNLSAKPVYQNGLMGVDAILNKPKPADITQTLTSILNTTAIEDAVQQTFESTTVIPQYVAPAAQETPTAVAGFNESMLEQPVEEVLPVPEYVPEQPVEPAEPELVDKSSELVQRIQSTNKVKDISGLMQEMTAATVIKDLINTNSTYAGIEEKLKSLNDTIAVILNDTRTHSLEEKLSKVRALLHDKAFFSSRGSTLIEQRLEEVIDAICEKTTSLIQSRLDEIDGAIRYLQEHRDFDITAARLSGLNEERANIMLELMTMEAEVDTICKQTDMLAIGTATAIAQEANTPTSSDIVNNHLKARGMDIVGDNVHAAVHAAIELTAEKVPDTFKELQVKIVAIRKMLSKLFDLDNEIIVAQQKQIAYLKAHNIEDTVVADNLLKKSLRVYVGEEGTGRSIITYLTSRYQSRMNANVLCLDLTGNGTYAQYGIDVYPLDKFLVERNQCQFMLVAGQVENTVESAQRIVSALLRAADYYRIINVVLTPDQQELFHTIAQDILSVNFVVDTNVKHLDNMKNLIADYKMDNMAQRVIVNRCDIPVRPIVTRLGLDDRIDFQICVIPTLPTLSDANLNGYDPYGVSAVDLIMEEVIKHVKS